jgi:D-alanine-D-alanine ligase
MHIEIVSSTLLRVGSMTQKSRDAIQEVLSKHYDNVGITIVNSLSDLEGLVAKKPDLVFLGMKFVPSDPTIGFTDPNRTWVADYLAECGIPTTGSDSSSQKLELNKPLAKQRVLNAGLATSPFQIAKANELLVATKSLTDYPLFVKPTDRGAGAGIDSDSVVTNFEQLQAKVAAITDELDADSLIEEYLPGREFSVAVLKNEHTAGYDIMPIELIPPADDHGSRILSRHVKSDIPLAPVAVVDSALRTAICDLAINVFHALGARDYGRIDIRLDQYGVPHFLEANLIPSLIDNYGSFPKACVLNINLGYEAMILNIAHLGLMHSSNSDTTNKPHLNTKHILESDLILSA